MSLMSTIYSHHNLNDEFNIKVSPESDDMLNEWLDIYKNTTNSLAGELKDNSSNSIVADKDTVDALASLSASDQSGKIINGTISTGTGQLWTTSTGTTPLQANKISTVPYQTPIYSPAKPKIEDMLGNVRAGTKIKWTIKSDKPFLNGKTFNGIVCTDPDNDNLLKVLIKIPGKNNQYDMVDLPPEYEVLSTPSTVTSIHKW